MEKRRDMKEKDLIQFCRYYGGETENPYEGMDAMLWDYERQWIRLTFDHDPILAEMVGEYSASGMSGFEAQDDTPASLKALLFDRYNHWNEDDGFKRWYKDTYLANTKRGQ